MSPTMSLEHMFRSYMNVYKQLKMSVAYDRTGFLHALGNACYYHFMVVEEVGRLIQAGIKIQMDRMNGKQILNRLQEHMQPV